MINGLIFDIKRFAVHDGPGIRTTVFFKGCPLSCWWCHNPESRSDEPQSSVRHLSVDGRLFEKEEVTGRIAGVDEILREIEKDRIYYEESGGGVTLSGGEPLHQPEFCKALLKILNENGFHTALDTCGYASAEVIRNMIPYTDLFLYDLKLMDDTEHQKYTGTSNRAILENLQCLLESGSEVIIRIPIIPGITDTKTNIRLIIDFLKSMRECRNKIHLLPYHETAKNKYKRFHMENKMGNGITVDNGRVSEMKALFEQAGFRTKTRG